MADMEKVVKGIEICLKDDACKGCPYYKHDHAYFCGIREILADTLELLKEQNELINELLDLGYPHNFQHEAPWVVDYLYKLTEIIKKAFNAKEGR